MAISPDELKRIFAAVQVEAGKQDWKSALPKLEILSKHLPKMAAIHSLRSGALRGVGRLTEALLSIQQARSLEPGNAHYLHLSGNILKDCGRMEEALSMLRDAAEQLDGNAGSFTDYLFALNYPSGWTCEAVSVAHRDFGKSLEARIKVLPPLCAPREKKEKLTVGFVSGDFCRHSISYFLMPLLRNLDRSKITTIAYSCSAYRDGTTAVFIKNFDRWVESSAMSDDQLAAKIRADNVDILIDLAGCTGGNRLGVFARRPSPLQISWLGYPNTTGLERIDYRIVDPITDPEGPNDTLYSERLLRLPGCFLCYEGVQSIEVKEAVPGRPFTFGSFNNHAKLSAATLDAWATILQRAPASRLLIKNNSLNDPNLVAKMVGYFGGKGIAATRIVCFGRIESEVSHLAAYGHVDLALDCFPYNGTTTTCEALWMGVPVMTYPGDRHSSRVSASILAAAGLNEWVAPDVDGYVAAAVACGKGDRKLPPRSAVRVQVAGSMLCDHPAYAKRFESLLEAIWNEGGRR